MEAPASALRLGNGLRAWKLAPAGLSCLDISGDSCLRGVDGAATLRASGVSDLALILGDRRGVGVPRAEVRGGMVSARVNDAPRSDPADPLEFVEAEEVAEQARPASAES